MATIKGNPSGGGTRHRRGHGRVTLADVAAVAGVTSITVSRYLRAPAMVAEPTATRIRAALAETGYVPHKQAGQLASGHSNMVAAIIPSIGYKLRGVSLHLAVYGKNAGQMPLLSVDLR